ncbi:MAG: NUDIX domain-containing protein [Candidatus Dojkabacteria bacterium]|jgi:8-oxo-dGTP pyrophosphatase MutT (NUDIX family)|nr:NUDIX domain-containing protein [Candidatus Dojkabacteria bacterium]
MNTKDNAKFHIVLVTGVIEKNGEYLIAQRSFEEIQAPGKWALPGGKVELSMPDNDRNVLETTLEREIEEEVAVRIYQKPIYVMSSAFTRVDNATVVGVLFLCKWKSGRAKALEDTINVSWVGIDELHKYDFCTGVTNSLRLADKKRLSLE